MARRCPTESEPGGRRGGAAPETAAAAPPIRDQRRLERRIEAFHRLMARRRQLAYLEACGQPASLATEEEFVAWLDRRLVDHFRAIARTARQRVAGPARA